jgi:hypothetical protein
VKQAWQRRENGTRLVEGPSSVDSGEGAQPLLALTNAHRPLIQAVATAALQRYSTVSERGWVPAIDSIGAWRLHASLPPCRPAQTPTKILPQHPVDGVDGSSDAGRAKMDGCPDLARPS